MVSEKISKAATEILKKQHYAIVGKHSAVQVCRWTKKSLIDGGFCYKQKFYKIKSHECCQMSAFLQCENQCVHCWRPIELDFGLKLKPKIKEIDKPGDIINGCILAQRKLLSGFKGNKNINMEKWKESQNPTQFAISLIGESTLYPKLAELILELKKRKITSFLVTNGLMPRKLLELKKKNALPTQLYLSLNTPNKKLYNQWHKSKEENAWKKFNQTLKLFSKLPTRKVIRMTIVKDLNMIEPENYAKLIKKALPDFIEIKAYMSIGFARQRLGYERMPSHAEIKVFSKKLLKELKKLKIKYKFLDEKIESRVVLLGKDKKRMRIKENEI